MRREHHRRVDALVEEEPVEDSIGDVGAGDLAAAIEPDGLGREPGTLIASKRPSSSRKPRQPLRSSS